MISNQDIRMEMPFAASMFRKLRRMMRLQSRNPSAKRELIRILIAAYALARGESGFSKEEFVAMARQVADYVSEATGEEPIRVEAAIVDAETQEA